MRIKKSKQLGRVAVVLQIPRHIYDVVEGWAVIQDKRPSSAIVDFLEEAKPQLLMVTQTFKAAKQGDREKAVETMVNASGLSLKRLGETMLKVTSK